jgi:hypothetical protein
LVAPRAAQEVTPEMLLKQVLTGFRDGTFSEKIKGIPIERLFLHVKTFYEKYKQDPSDTHSLEVAKAFANLIYLLNPDYKKDAFENIINSVTHAWLEYIPKSIKAARPLKSIPGEVIERLAIPLAKPLQKTDDIIQLPAHAKTAVMADKVEEEFDPENLKKAKYKYNIAEFAFVLRDYSTTYKYLMIVLDTPYMNIDANNLLIQNSILWSEQMMQQNSFEEAMGILDQINTKGMDSNTLELINDKVKETTVLLKIIQLEEKCPLNERSVGPFLRERIGYKKFLRLTYFIFGNIEFHQRLEEIRVFPKKMIYPLLNRKPTQKTEDLIEKRNEQHEQLIRDLYDWFWELDVVKHYLTPQEKEDLTEKFGEFGSGPVIYFRYISKGQYANIIISKAVALIGQGKIQLAKKELFETYELTGSNKIKGYLDFLRQHEKSRKASKSKSKKRVKMTKRKKK